LTDKHQTAVESAITVLFTSAPGLVDEILRALTPIRPSFIYERSSTRTRQIERTYIGVGRRAVGPTGKDAFTDLREQLAAPAQTTPAQAVMTFMSYETLVGARSGETATPAQLLIEPVFLIDLDHVTGRATLSGDFQRQLEAIQAAMARAGTAATHQPRHPDGDDSVKDWKVRPAEDEFVRNASALQLEMAGRDDVVGAALSVELELDAQLDALEAFQALRPINPSTCMFFLEDGEFALWGATSLPLLKVNGRDLTAETDGATRRVEAGAPDDWIPSDKENAEYDLVVAALREDLDGLITPSSLVFSADREPRQYFNLRHLFAEISGRLAEGTDAVTALQRLTPHGAATGYAKPAAIALIERFDIRPRGPYAGAIGVFSRDGSADAACVIRSAWKVGSTICTRAGAKVVAGSDPAAEYQESVLKTLPLRRSVAQSLPAMGLLLSD
jgi:anthranilate synthase component 1